MIKFLRLAENLGRAILWLDKARGRDHTRVSLEQYNVEGPQKGQIGSGCVTTADCYRLHIIQELNVEPLDDDEPDMLEFDERLHLEAGLYHFRTKIQAADHINEIVDEPTTYPDIYNIIPSMNRGAKPYALIALDPKFLRDALIGADDNVLIRVYQNQDDYEAGSIACRQPVEVITVDKHSGLNRMAVIMPKHLGWPERESRELKAGVGADWPVKWTGKFPEKEEVENDGNTNDSE